MSGTIKSSYATEETAVWIRGLVSLAWADGHFDPEEQEMITELLHQDLPEEEKSKALEPIAPADVAEILGKDPHLAENFLRTAVMVALSDGDYSLNEDKLLHQYCELLHLQPNALQVLRSTLQHISDSQPPQEAVQGEFSMLPHPTDSDHLDVLNPVREWLDSMDVQDPKVAKLLCKVIPSQCPFERDIKVFGRKLVHIPPLCKLNPLYEQLVGIRFRALSYLADDCGEDISEFI